MMSRGHLDYGQSGQISFGSSMPDLGELAVRLGAVTSYYRTGKVLYFDNFDVGIGSWRTVTPGTGTIIHDTTNPYMGAGSVLITNDSTSSNIAYIYKHIPWVGDLTFGIEALLMGSNTLALEVYLEVLVVSDGKSYNFSVKITPADNKVYVLHEDSSYRLVATLNKLFINSYAPLAVKFIANMETMYYTRIHLNDESFDISAYQSNSGNLDEEDSVMIRIKNKNTNGQSDPLQIDNVIFTVDEP